LKRANFNERKKEIACGETHSEAGEKGPGEPSKIATTGGGGGHAHYVQNGPSLTKIVHRPILKAEREGGSYRYQKMSNTLTNSLHRVVVEKEEGAPREQTLDKTARKAHPPIKGVYWIY